MTSMTSSSPSPFPVLPNRSCTWKALQPHGTVGRSKWQCARATFCKYKTFFEWLYPPGQSLALKASGCPTTLAKTCALENTWGHILSSVKKVSEQNHILPRQKYSSFKVPGPKKALIDSLSPDAVSDWILAYPRSFTQDRAPRQGSYKAVKPLSFLPGWQIPEVSEPVRALHRTLAAIRILLQDSRSNTRQQWSGEVILLSSLSSL